MMDDEKKDSAVSGIAAGATSEQAKVLFNTAEVQSQRVNEARKAFDEMRDKIISFTRPELGQSLERLELSQALENAFAYGHTAGEASESALALREQMELLARMNAEVERRNDRQQERDDARDKKREVLDARFVEYSERQVKALEALVDVAKGSAGISLVDLAKSR